MRLMILYSTNNGEQRAHIATASFINTIDDAKANALRTFGVPVGDDGDQANIEAAWWIVQLADDGFEPFILDGEGDDVPIERCRVVT